MTKMKIKRNLRKKMKRKNPRKKRATLPSRLFNNKS